MTSHWLPVLRYIPKPERTPFRQVNSMRQPFELGDDIATAEEEEGWYAARDVEREVDVRADWSGDWPPATGARQANSGYGDAVLEEVQTRDGSVRVDGQPELAGCTLHLKSNVDHGQLAALDVVGITV